VWISSTVPAPFSSDHKAAQAFGETAAVARWRGTYVYDPDTRHREHGLAVPGAVGGHLALYRGGLTFAASATEDNLRDRSMVVVPAAEVVRARVVPARAGANGVVRRGVLWRSLYPAVGGRHPRRIPAVRGGRRQPQGGHDHRDARAAVALTIRPAAYLRDTKGIQSLTWIPLGRVDQVSR
jgi:hypothetical protein